MPGNLLNVPLRKMSQTADCLAACAAMVLDYMGHPVNYTDLLRLLEVGPLGTPAGRIMRLGQWGVSVEYGEGSLEALQSSDEFLLAWLEMSNRYAVLSA